VQSCLLNIDDPEYFDYLRQRPVIVLDEHGDRDFLWPSIELWGPSKDKARENNLSLYFLIGQEPALQWPYLRDEIREIVEDPEHESRLSLVAIASWNAGAFDTGSKEYKNKTFAPSKEAFREFIEGHA